MRCSIIGATTQQVLEAGGTNVKEAPKIGMVFADLTPAQIAELQSQGSVVSPVGEIKTAVTPPTPQAGAPTYTPSQLASLAGIEVLRGITEPMLYGKNLNIAVLDSGIRETHELLAGHVIHNKAIASSTPNDVFGHGTSVASVIAEIAPQCGILNVKVLDDTGVGTEEDAALGIDYVIGLKDTNPTLVPLVINLSLGAPDDGNPNNALRVACRAAVQQNINVIAAAGNSGPNSGTIMSPACDFYVGAVGSVGAEPFTISRFSSRGPTREGVTKPDVVMFGENLVLAGNVSNTATVSVSGTSFSTPFDSAILLLTQEAIIRGVYFPGGIPSDFRMDALPKEALPASDIELWDMWTSRVSVKPSGTPSGKDNDYGWGLPLGNLIIQALAQPSAMSGLLSAVVMVGMMGIMMKSMKSTKSIERAV